MLKDPRYKFTEKWFDIAISTWEKLFKELNPPKKPINVLEIGCYEGRATIWLCENVEISKYFVIDTFKGSDEDGMKHTKERFEDDDNFIRNNFEHNISFFPEIEFHIHEGISQNILPTINEKFDFIYIDGSHRSDDVFVDAYFANRLLNNGGMIVFDDYGWKDTKNLHPNNSPEIGVDFFNTMYESEYNLIFSGYQVGFKKL